MLVHSRKLFEAGIGKKSCYCYILTMKLVNSGTSFPNIEDLLDIEIRENEQEIWKEC